MSPIFANGAVTAAFSSAVSEGVSKINQASGDRNNNTISDEEYANLTDKEKQEYGQRLVDRELEKVYEDYPEASRPDDLVVTAVIGEHKETTATARYMVNLSGAIKLTYILKVKMLVQLGQLYFMKYYILMKQ